MDSLELQRKIVPEIVDTLEIRFDILRGIYFNQPIGRRKLALMLNKEERPIRTGISILKEQGLINVDSMGMYVTEEGKRVITNLKIFIRELKGIANLEGNLQKVLGINNAIIVPGDSDENKMVLKDIGKIASVYLKKIIMEDYIIGITGGSTMAQLAEEMPVGKLANNVLVLPARGGLGRDLETQSNSIAAKIAKKIEADYRLLHVPDNLDKTTMEAVLKIPEIKEVIGLIAQLNVLIFGIGRADIMAKTRQLPEFEIERILGNGAVGEAFGHYFDINGGDIYESTTVGLKLKDFKQIGTVIGVAGGKNKAEAIMSIASLRKDLTIITDEAAAKRIISIV